MSQWVIDDLELFRDVFLKYNHDEPALSSCAMTMMRMLNGLSEMAYTKFHRYEKRMFWGAMELFSKQCIEQIYIAQKCHTVEKKKEYILDIESSISEMAEVYKNIMGGVSDTERHMFQSLSVDIKTHELSPKLCAFYSSILEKVAAMFKEDGAEYAFVLHPVLHSTIEAKILLEKREQSGKVVIIYVSERVIEEFDLVSICLLHEAFHVLTKAERMRSKRAQFFTAQMIEQMRCLVFQNVSFRTNDNEIKEELTKRWFRCVNEQMNEFAQREKNDKSFYGHRIIVEVENKFKEYLMGIDLDLNRIIMGIVCRNKSFKDYSEYQQQAYDIEENAKRIKTNVFHIVSENIITEIANQIMFIYRETYADIACILLLEIEPEWYQRAFYRSIQFQYDTSYVDDAKILRESLVAKIVSARISSELQESWRCYLDLLNRKKTDNKIVENQLPKGDFYDRIEINDTVRGAYEDYLEESANLFFARLQNLDGIEGFRAYMKDVITGSPQRLLGNILGGDVI